VKIVVFTPSHTVSAPSWRSPPTLCQGSFPTWMLMCCTNLRIDYVLETHMGSVKGATAARRSRGRKLAARAQMSLFPAPGHLAPPYPLPFGLSRSSPKQEDERSPASKTRIDCHQRRCRFDATRGHRGPDSDRLGRSARSISGDNGRGPALRAGRQFPSERWDERWPSTCRRSSI